MNMKRQKKKIKNKKPKRFVYNFVHLRKNIYKTIYYSIFIYILLTLNCQREGYIVFKYIFAPPLRYRCDVSTFFLLINIYLFI